MRFIKDCDDDFINAEYITYVYRIDDDVYARIIGEESNDLCLYKGESLRDANDFMQDIIKQITGGE